MNQKTTIALVFALVVVFGGVWWAESSKKPPKPPGDSGPKSLLDPPLGEIAEFEIVTAGGAPIRFELKKDKWWIVTPIACLAEHWTVDGDANKIKTLKYVREFPKGDADSPTEEMTSLAKPLKSCKLTTKEGKSQVVKIGAVQALSKKTYVQVEGRDTVYLVQGDLNADLRRGMADYRSKQVAPFSQSDAIRVEESGERQFTLAKSGANWLVDAPIKARADAAAVGRILSSAAALSAVKFVDDNPATLRPYGLDTPRLTLSIVTETKTPKPPPATQPASAPAEPQFDIETKTVRLAFGATVEGNVFARLEDEGAKAVFQVSETVFKQIAQSLDELRDKSVADLQINRAQSLSVTSGGQSATLVRNQGLWQIESGAPGGKPTSAEFVAVDDLLKTIRDLKAMAFEPGLSAGAQGLDNPRSAIEVTVEGQVEPLRLKVGGLTPSKTGAYLLNEKENTVCVVKAESADALVVRPLDFLSRELVKFARDRCSKIDIAFPKYGVSLALQAGSSNWDFTAPVSGKADFGAVNAILSDLFNLRGRKVVGLSSDAGRFGLDTSAVRVVLTVDVPPVPKPPPASATTQDTGPPEMVPQPPETLVLLANRQGDKVYAMSGGGGTICEIDAKVLDDLLAELLDTQFARLESSQARKLVFNGASSFALEKASDNWRLAGEPSFAADPTKITAFFTTIQDLRAKEYTRYSGAKLSDYGLDSPALSITAETDSASPVTIHVSARGPEKGGRYACTESQRDRVFVIKAEDMDKLMKKVQDFQKS